MCLAHAGGPKKHEGAYGFVGVLKPHPVAPYGLDHFLHGIVLSDHGAAKGIVHFQQSVALGLSYALHGHPCHHSHHFGHFVVVDRHTAVAHLFLPPSLSFVEIGAQMLLFVAKRCRLFEILGTHGIEFRLFGLAHLLFKRFYLGRHGDVGDVYTRSGLVHRVDGLVGKCAVAHIAFRQFHTGFKSRFGVADVMMVLVFFLDIMEYGQSLLWGCRLDHYFLESAFERSVLFDTGAVFVECGGTDALNLTARQRRLEHIGGIHGSGGIAGAHYCVDLVDE